jgi:uncharacterized protein YehS (DUF1456 family)
MNNNDILRRVRYALDIGDSSVIGIFALSEYTMTQAELLDLLKKEEDPGFVECADVILDRFLDGLIVSRRGKRESGAVLPAKPKVRFSNNTVLKKLRVALELKDDDLHEISRLGGMEMSKSEMTALFRKEGQKNFKECGDQFLRNFLKGLAIKYRDRS